MKISHFIFPLFLFSFTPLPILSAQEVEDSVRFNFSIVVLGDTFQQYEKLEDIQLILPLGEEEFEEFTLQIDRPTDLRSYTGSPELRFYQVVSGQQNETMQTSEAIKSSSSMVRPFVTVKVPAGNRADTLIAIIVPSKRKPVAIAVPLPEDLDTPGYAYTLNLSNKKMAARINDTTGMIQPGTYFETNLNDISNYKLRIDLAVEIDGDWQRVVSQNTTASSKSRLLFLLYQSPTTGRWVQKKLGLPEKILTPPEIPQSE